MKKTELFIKTAAKKVSKFNGSAAVISGALNGLLGAGIGAGIGRLSYALKDDSGMSEEERKLLKRRYMGLGAGIGGLGLGGYYGYKSGRDFDKNLAKARKMFRQNFY